MTPSLGIEPGLHWWEASALTTAPPLLSTLWSRWLFTWGLRGLWSIHSLVLQVATFVPLKKRMATMLQPQTGRRGFVISSRCKFDPYQLIWHQIPVFHFPPTRHHSFLRNQPFVSSVSPSPERRSRNGNCCRSNEGRIFIIALVILVTTKSHKERTPVR